MDYDMQHIAIQYARDETQPKQGAVQVGWLHTDTKTSVLYDPPKRVTSAPQNREHAKSASRCPAILNMETRYFEVNCPFDIHIGFSRDKDGKPTLINRAGTKSPIRANKLGNALVLTSEREWRFPDRPTVQLKMPYM
ncbi:MAG: hypothetical protein AAF701_05740, partial [Pseudomonadota bacterium]